MIFLSIDLIHFYTALLTILTTIYVFLNIVKLDEVPEIGKIQFYSFEAKQNLKHLAKSRETRTPSQETKKTLTTYVSLALVTNFATTR